MEAVVPHTDPESTGQPGEKQGDGKSGPSKDQESGDCSYVEHREHDRRRPVDPPPFRYGELGTHYVRLRGTASFGLAERLIVVAGQRSTGRCDEFGAAGFDEIAGLRNDALQDFENLAHASFMVDEFRKRPDKGGPRAAPRQWDAFFVLWSSYEDALPV